MSTRDSDRETLKFSFFIGKVSCFSAADIFDTAAILLWISFPIWSTAGCLGGRNGAGTSQKSQRGIPAFKGITTLFSLGMTSTYFQCQSMTENK